MSLRTNTDDEDFTFLLNLSVFHSSGFRNVCNILLTSFSVIPLLVLMRGSSFITSKQIALNVYLVSHLVSKAFEKFSNIKKLPQWDSNQLSLYCQFNTLSLRHSSNVWKSETSVDALTKLKDPPYYDLSQWLLAEMLNSKTNPHGGNIFLTRIFF